MKPLVVGCHNVDKTHIYKSIEIRKKLKQKCKVCKDKHRILEKKVGGRCKSALMSLEKHSMEGTM